MIRVLRGGSVKPNPSASIRRVQQSGTAKQEVRQ